MIKNPGYRNLQSKFFGRHAPDQNINLCPHEGVANEVLGEGSLLYYFLKFGLSSKSRAF